MLIKYSLIIRPCHGVAVTAHDFFLIVHYFFLSLLEISVEEGHVVVGFVTFGSAFPFSSSSYLYLLILPLS